ncbi:phosphoenolpyruvate carboxykinase [Reyranella sp. CPCC 100927]|uniref:phosphoenolpyruvate carboxykinase n=1 Tax=Reyranella sp. CPCC 100927 TaxID=2599616 RepID=UPI0011B3F947|nr:phosphoenolpyruvate carboxykinase [Reyranella sp. CPCC 100927]
MQQAGMAISKHGLDSLGLKNLGNVHWNLPVSALYEHAIRRGEGVLSKGGPLCVLTGVHTGRSPGDKFFVRELSSEGKIDWGKTNQAIEARQFDGLLSRMLAYAQRRDLYVRECYAGADPAHRIGVRVITETAWHNLFAMNMFLRPPREDLADFRPDFTILQLPGFQAVPEIDGTRSDCAIVCDFRRNLVAICGTWYAGEIKKSVFTILNYLLPEKNVLPMHASANIGPKGDVAIFFGLSGTGKTTLSADASRTLIGDDEHGWGESSVFNFEGGCYAKVIKLSREAEPEIYATTERFGTVLENVVVDPLTGLLDLDSNKFTENTRACYPLDFIPNASVTGIAKTPDNIIMLTADAFGVLPPISRLSPEQAMYHFLSGYTARVAGTEKGVSEPQATFSTCFGAPFMPRHPTVYAKMLGEKMARQNVKCWLVNTGWSGGGFGVGERMSIRHTRAMVRAALDGRLAQVASTPDPHFGLLVPSACPDVPSDVLNPLTSWKDKKAYETAARDVARRFESNFKQFETAVDGKVKQAAIRAAA